VTILTDPGGNETDALFDLVEIEGREVLEIGCASLAYAATHDLKATAERLGHTSIEDGRHYVKLYQDADRRVADAIDELVRALIVHETDH